MPKQQNSRHLHAKKTPQHALQKPQRIPVANRKLAHLAQYNENHWASQKSPSPEPAPAYIALALFPLAKGGHNYVTTPLDRILLGYLLEGANRGDLSLRGQFVEARAQRIRWKWPRFKPRATHILSLSLSPPPYINFASFLYWRSYMYVPRGSNLLRPAKLLASVHAARKLSARSLLISVSYWCGLWDCRQGCINVYGVYRRCSCGWNFKVLPEEGLLGVGIRSNETVVGIL